MYYLKQKFFKKKICIDIILLCFISLLLIYSIFILWSASGQNIEIIQYKIIHIILGFSIMLIIAQISPRIYEGWASYLYFLCIFLLILVDIFGQTSKGAKRWLQLGIIRFQPSEFAKIIVPLMIARYINRSNYPLSFKNIIIILLLIIIPTLLVARQPDLGTSVLIIISGLLVLFLSGIHWKFLLIILLFIMILIPILWLFFMHDYQRERIMILIHPTSDPLGSGYHIIQSKIAIGSGGWLGKGWLKGTQSQLEFLPERHTDFIFAVLGEEMGLVGILILLILYLGIIIRSLTIAIQAQNIFGKIIAGSLTCILFIYIFVNIGMVSGILPIVGIPLPLISYGGSSLIVIMSSFGIIMSIHTHRNILSKNI